MTLHRCFDSSPIFFELFLIDGFSSCEYDVCRHDRSPSLLIDYRRARLAPLRCADYCEGSGREPEGPVRRNPQQAYLHRNSAAVDRQIDARDEAAFVGRQEQNGRRNLFRPSNPLQWSHGYKPVLHRADVRAELGVEKGRFDRAWADHVGADALAR